METADHDEDEHESAGCRPISRRDAHPCARGRIEGRRSLYDVVIGPQGLRTLPFKPGYPEHEDILTRARGRFTEVREESMRRFRAPDGDWSGRTGLAAVYATGKIVELEYLLTNWRWRYALHGGFPSWLEAVQFSDDPAIVVPDTGLDFRVSAAVAFADAANAILQPKDGEFRWRVIELVEASGGRPAGFHRGDVSDVLAVDLMLGRTNHVVIDALVKEVWALFPHFWKYGDVTNQHIELWHRVERLNAARTLLSPESPLVRLPGMATTKRRLASLAEGG